MLEEADTSVLPFAPTVKVLWHKRIGFDGELGTLVSERSAFFRNYRILYSSIPCTVLEGRCCLLCMGTHVSRVISYDSYEPRYRRNRA